MKLTQIETKLMSLFFIDKCLLKGHYIAMTDIEFLNAVANSRAGMIGFCAYLSISPSTYRTWRQRGISKRRRAEAMYYGLDILSLEINPRQFLGAKSPSQLSTNTHEIHHTTNPCDAVTAK